MRDRQRRFRLAKIQLELQHLQHQMDRSGFDEIVNKTIEKLLRERSNIEALIELQNSLELKN
jgi:hypothetical protein